MRVTPDLGRLVRDSRVLIGLSKRNAADQAGMSEVTWTRIEANERVRPDTLHRAAAVLGVDGDLLVAAAHDPQRLPDLEAALSRRRRSGASPDLSTVSDAALVGELTARLSTRRQTLLKTLAAQGGDQRTA